MLWKLHEIALSCFIYFCQKKDICMYGIAVMNSIFLPAFLSATLKKSSFWDTQTYQHLGWALHS